jgi:hypothetical protein
MREIYSEFGGTRIPAACELHDRRFGDFKMRSRQDAVPPFFHYVFFFFLRDLFSRARRFAAS